MSIKIVIFTSLLVLFSSKPVFSGLLINEIAFNTAGDDWVELFYYNENEGSIDVSAFHVTMYYGTSETLSAEPVTLYSHDRPGTPWDDRFAVVHLTAPGKTDETDTTGDTNGNGYIDIYCNNYFTSLWSTDCTVSIDTDNNSSNGGITDFAAYSNRDGEVNTSVASYVANAQSFGQWAAYSGENIQECMVDIGLNELPSYITLARKNLNDTNSLNDFNLTKYATPGRENILEANNAGSRLFRINKKKVMVKTDDFAKGYSEIGIYIYNSCKVRFRIFSSIGVLVYESELSEDMIPGDNTLQWSLNNFNKKSATGLYIAQIEAVNSKLKKSQRERIYVILSKFK